MKKVLKIIGFSLLGLIILAVGAMGFFYYKITGGMASFDETPPELVLEDGVPAILVYSKTNGFRHGEAIEASIPVYQKIAGQNGWQVFSTENGAVFNDEYLEKFDIVIWNNVTGPTLNDEQRASFRKYLENGGGFIGIHGAGDNSHKWEWYEQEVLKADFSHHNLSAEPVEAPMQLEVDTAFAQLYDGLDPNPRHADEWYVFFESPRGKGVNVLYTMDESGINMSGNIPILASGKDWGMGEDHVSVWYHEMGDAKIFYSALGHHGAAFQSENMQRMLENAMRWMME